MVRASYYGSDREEMESCNHPQGPPRLDSKHLPDLGSMVGMLVCSGRATAEEEVVGVVVVEACDGEGGGG